jgi:hypothetical protein
MDGTLSVNLEWQPQQRVDWALLLSLVAIVACVVLAIGPVRSRGRKGSGRRRGRHSPGPPAQDGDHPFAIELPASDRSDGPSLVMPFRAEAPRSPVWVAVLAGLVTGVVGGAISTAGIGLVAGVVTGIVLVVPRLRIALGLTAVAGIVSAGTYMVLHQHADRIPAGGEWTVFFATASTLAWAGVVFLGADGMVDVLQRRRLPGPTGPTSGPPGPEVEPSEPVIAPPAPGSRAPAGSGRADPADDSG